MSLRLLPPDSKLGWTPYAWLVYLGFLYLWLLRKSGTLFDWALVIGSTAVFLPLYFLAFWSRPRQLLWIIAAIFGLGTLVAPFNPGGGCYFIYAAAFIGDTGPARVALKRLLLLLGAIVAEVALLQIPYQAWIPGLVLSAIVGGTNIHFAEVRRKDHHLQLAQQAVEEMARVAERERISRDLHDLLGHTLSLIVLKAELASKLAGRDPARALQEIQDVERISRETLGEVRKAVRGYRTEGIKEELQHAGRVLTAAGLQAIFDVAPVELPPDEDRALGFALREAVTNVVRHACATKCWVRLSVQDGRAVLEVRDNGRGGFAPEGSGLAGMRERLRQVAGTLERDGNGGTKIVVSLPAQAARLVTS